MISSRLTVDELAERWQLSAMTLHQWRWKGKGPQYMKIGKRVTYRLQDIEAFEESQLRSSTSHKPGG